MCRPSLRPSRCGRPEGYRRLACGPAAVAGAEAACKSCCITNAAQHAPVAISASCRIHNAPHSALPCYPPQALSELQKENSGLRAACVTLGRELLSLKSEFMAFQQQTLSALVAVSPNAAAMLLNPSPAASPMDVPMVAPSAAAGEAAAVASAAAAAGAPAEQLQGYQAAAAEAQHQQQFAATALSAGGTPTAAEAEAAAAVMAAAATALPAHMPAAAAPAAAAAAPQRDLPRGDIVLVGGHDSGSWLDSVGEWSRTLGVSSARCLQCCWWAVVRAAAALGQPRLLTAAASRAARCSQCYFAAPNLSIATAPFPPCSLTPARRLLQPARSRVGQPAAAGQASLLLCGSGHRCAALACPGDASHWALIGHGHSSCA